MPNHVENHIEFSGDTRQIKAMLESIKNDEYGIGTAMSRIRITTAPTH